MIEMTRAEELDLTVDVLDLQHLTELARDGLAALAPICGNTVRVCGKTV